MRLVPSLLSPAAFLRLRRHTASLVAGVGVVVCAAVPASAAAATVERTETPIVSSSPQSDVAASLVRIHVPLPATAAPHPAACDWLQYVRFRPVDGPADSMQADSVAFLMPGIMEGAMALDPLARNTVRAAKRQGRNVEVWALDRRSNCLEDHTGLDRYEQSGDFNDAIDYYFHGASIDGRTFAGIDTNNRVLADIGLEQTVRDMYSVLTDELPDQNWREHHVVCGGHSLGGPLTQVFAGWDFDHDKATTTDAGYRQCAGFVGFEGYLDLDPTQDTPALQAAIKLLTLGQTNFLRRISVSALKRGLIPQRADIDGADPYSTMALEMIATAAYKDPTGSAAPLLRAIPHIKSIDSYFHIMGSASLQRLAFSKDSVRDYGYTNAGLLGQLLDDNGTAISPVRASFGFFTGGPLRRNIVDDQLSPIPGINLAFQISSVMLPYKAKPNIPLTGWANYDALGSGDTQIGAKLTSPAREVTDARDFARIQFEGPTDFTEPYFPLRMVLDLTAFYGHDKGGELSGYFYRHPTTRKPRMLAIGTEGEVIKAKVGSPDPTVILPGYNHVDSITAAEKQNDGKPEGSSTMLVNMINRVVPQ
jgi:pimeloyl-ACP methyl ester carboxylesterase